MTDKKFELTGITIEHEGNAWVSGDARLFPDEPAIPMFPDGPAIPMFLDASKAAAFLEFVATAANKI